jgi:hypothetical protein
VPQDRQIGGQTTDGLLLLRRQQLELTLKETFIFLMQFPIPEQELWELSKVDFRARIP